MAIDGHLWLNPENARIIARGVAESLAEIDPARAATYLENAERYGMRLAALDAELRQRLAPVADRPYIVLHDAYQYFEQRFGLAAAGSIAVNPERRPGARRIREMRAKVSDLGARCVFGEPQYRAAIVEVVVDGTGARIGSLDPLGADVPPGGDAYFTMMRDLADSLTRCLGDG